MNGTGVQRLLVKAAVDLRHLHSENQRLEKLAEQLDKVGMVRDAIQALIAKGRITQPQEVLDKMASLMEQSVEDLAVLTKAAELDSPAFADALSATDDADPSSLNAEGRFWASIL